MMYRLTIERGWDGDFLVLAIFPVGHADFVQIED
jgi:hypothetical protein